MLHILSTSDHTIVKNCIMALTAQDILVILSKSLHEPLSETDYSTAQQNSAKVYYIEESTDRPSTIILGSTHISYDDFVDLCCQHQNITSWY